VRNTERIARFRELAARQARCQSGFQDYYEEAAAFMEEPGPKDDDHATELLERLAQLEAERDAILHELARVDPAFTAGMN
jgi:hypothetical protein